MILLPRGFSQTCLKMTERHVYVVSLPKGVTMAVLLSTKQDVMVVDAHEVEHLG